MKKVDDLFYEARPFLLFCLVAFAGNQAPKTALAHGSIGLLALSAMMISYWRYQYRATVHLRRR